jgi:hypothetical protein
MNDIMVRKHISDFEQYAHRTILRMRARASQRIVDSPFETVELPLNLFTYTIKARYLPVQRRRKMLFSEVRVAGYIAGGDWDQKWIQSGRISDRYHYKGFIERFVEGKEWEDTLYYTKFNERIKKRGHTRGGVTTWDEYKVTFLNSWDQLYLDIKNNGYKQQELISGKPEDEIEVGISRKGKVLMLDGIHRITIAKILGVKKVPVIVNIWHEEFYRNASKKISGNKMTPKLLAKSIIEETSLPIQTGALPS